MHRSFTYDISYEMAGLIALTLRGRQPTEDPQYTIFQPLSHYRVSTAYQDTKGMSRVRRTYVSIRS